MEETHQEEQTAPETGETAIPSEEPERETESVNGNFEDNAIDSELKMHLDEWGSVAHERPLRVMVCGLGGVGKSTLINRLLQLKDGEMWAEEGRQGAAKSSVVTKYERTTERGVKVCLFDTPGFDDIDIKDEVIIAMIEKETEKKLDVIFYCLSLAGAARVQGGDKRAIRLMTQAFGSQIWKKAVVVLTFANDLEEKRSTRSAEDYWSVIRTITENVKAVLLKEQVSDDIIKELPIQTAGHTEPILRYEEECEQIGGWDNRLFLEALKQVDPAVLPALLEIRFGWKDVGAALGGGGGGAAVGAVIGGAAGVVMGPPGVLVGAAAGAGLGAALGGAGGAGLGVLAYQLMKIKTVLRIKYIKWRLDRKPTSPRQASTEN